MTTAHAREQNRRMSNVEYLARVLHAEPQRSSAAASARSPREDGPASASASTPRPVTRGETALSLRSRKIVAATLPDTGFVRLPVILAVLPVSRSRWWAGVKLGTYPAAVKLGQRTTAWRVEDVKALIARLASG